MDLRTHSRSDGGRIGPNAIIRVAEALREQVGDATTARVFEGAGLHAYLDAPPSAMVDEIEVAALHRQLRGELGEAAARRAAHAAGVKTGDYLLAHRIPRGVQRVLRRLPAALASRVLLAAIRRNAWTFCGSGHFAASSGRTARVTITGNPLARDRRGEGTACAFYAGTFERLFRDLVDARAVVRETQCQDCKDPSCVFEIDWR